MTRTPKLGVHLGIILMLKPKPKFMQARWEQGRVLSWDGHRGLN